MDNVEIGQAQGGDQTQRSKRDVTTEQRPLLSSESGNGSKFCGARWQLILVVLIAVGLGLGLGIYYGIRSNNGGNNNNKGNHHGGGSSTKQSQMYGEWPYYGVHSENHNRQTNSSINSSNLDTLRITCVHNLDTNTVIKGHITVDDNKNVYWADSTGHISSMNLRTCKLNWQHSIAGLLGYDEQRVRLQNYEPPTLYLDKDGEKKLIFGTPNDGRVNYSDLEPVWAVSLKVSDGSLVWKTPLDSGYTATCAKSHGFIVDDKGFAYGGISLDCPGSAPDSPAITGSFQGKFFKMDVNTGDIVQTWFSYPPSFVRSANDTNETYKSAGVWGAAAIHHGWITFGTANLFSYPDYVNDCFESFDLFMDGNISWLEPPSFENNPIDPCGHNRSLDNRWYHCLEKDVYSSALIVLESSDFSPIIQQPSNGLDAWNKYCRSGTPGEICPLHQGPDADISAVSMWTDLDTNQSYVTAFGKNGWLLQYEVPSGELSFSVKLGPWSTSGGGRWGIGVDPDRKIAVARITGGNPSQIYRQTLADGRITCRTGITFIVDLLTGHVMFQIVNPFGYIGNETCYDQSWTSVMDEYSDMTKDNSCNIGSDGNEIPNIVDSSATVIIAERPSDSRDDASSTSDIPLVLAKDLLFLPTDAYVFVHSLDDGSVVNRFRCPNPDSYVRAISVISDELIMFCYGDPSTMVVFSL